MDWIMKRTKFPKRSPFRGKILKRAKKDRQKRKESGQFWQTDVKFDHGIILSSSKNSLINSLFEEFYQGEYGYNKDQKVTDLKILVANLIRQGKRRPIRLPLNENKWTKSPYKRASRFIINLVHKMEESGYIEMKIGNEAINRETRVLATDQLLARCKFLPEAVIYEPVNLVELKTFQGKYKNKPTKKEPDRKPKKVYELAPYDDTQKTIGIKKKLKQANLINNNATILYDNKKISVSLVAIFIENFSMYGRLHTRAYYHLHHLQNLSEEQRGELTINGDPVVELDYSAIHPNLLYASEGIQHPVEEDIYSKVNNHEFARPFLKIILLCMLNNDNFKAAEAAANKWLNKKDIKDEEDYIIDSHKRRLKSIGIKSAGPLMREMMKEHKPISKHFFNGKKTGMRVMNKDAAIALDVVYHFAQKEIPILPIHDSFIVQAQYKDELYDVMKKAYRKHTRKGNKYFDIRIK